MPGIDNLPTLVGPVLALIALGVLASAIRRMMAAPKPALSGEPRNWLTPPEPRDYGLLEEIAIVDGPFEADALRDALAHANVRTTVVLEHDGRVRVLVFNDEVNFARRVLADRQ